MVGLSNKGSKEIDKIMIDEIGLPGVVLMEEAALGIYHAMSSRYNLKDKSVYIFVGKGNNGGDGLALGRILFNRGVDVKIITLFDEGYSYEARLHLDVARRMGIDILKWNEHLEKPDLIVDAIFGTGFNGETRGTVKEAVDWIEGSDARVVAVDMPTNLDADMTVALGYLKFDHLMRSDLRNVYLARLEYAAEIEERAAEEDKLYYLDDYEAGKLLPLRKLEGHKGTFGKVGILGGSREMSGAGLLAGMAALRTGCGLATVWLESLDGIIGKAPELMLERWSDFLNKEIDVLIIGPGLGREKTLELEGVLRSFKGKVLIDADGLYWLKMGWIRRDWIDGELVVTPHPKEMEMILGESPGRRESVLKTASIYNCVAIIKGFRTLVSDGKSVWVNLTGNPGMATAGSGDVLSGIIGGLLAQGLENYEAVVLGTYLHGLSGDLGARDLGYESIIAGDLISYLPKAFNRVRAVMEDMSVVRKIY